jgi:alpha-glucosidase (family GH31 glycosyl hydrolase)
MQLYTPQYAFPDDVAAVRRMDRAFMFGNAIMVTPVLEEDGRNVDVQYPAGKRWFDWETGITLIRETEKKRYVVFIVRDL